jgi:hypothetical protein
MKKPILFITAFFLSIVSTMAQGPPAPGGGPPNNPGPVDDVPVPIDDHIWIVMLLGLILGLYFIFSKKSVFRN